MLKMRLAKRHDTRVEMLPVSDMRDTLRYHDEDSGTVYLSEVLDHQNRAFQLAHVLCLIEFPHVLDRLTRDSGIESEREITRCQVELGELFRRRLPDALQGLLSGRRGQQLRCRHAGGDVRGLLRAGLPQADHPAAARLPRRALLLPAGRQGRQCDQAVQLHLVHPGRPRRRLPVWNIHTSFRTPGIIIPQFVELPDGERYFTISRTTERPAFSSQTQDRRLALALGCELKYAHKIGYAQSFNLQNEQLFSPIGINCHLCPRQACSQRAYQPMLVELPIDSRRRGNTRYES